MSAADGDELTGGAADDGAAVGAGASDDGLPAPPRLSADWTPIRFYWQAEAPFVDWCHTGGVRFNAPFFDHTIEQCLRHPFNALCRPQTPAAAVAAATAGTPTHAPAGFIFHLSRCGSTVVSRMLAALPRHVVVSEPSVLDGVLRAPFKHPHVTLHDLAAWLRALVGALGRPRSADEQRFFVKFDGWQAVCLPFVRRVFPEVPCLFVYREPVEVMASQLRSPARWVTPGFLPPHLLGLDFYEQYTLAPADYCARVLAVICRAALAETEARPDGSDAALFRLVNHRQLPAVVTDELLHFFRLTTTDAERDAMRATTKFHAKEPARRYTDDSAAKRRAAGEDVQQAAARWINPLYEQLEARRLNTPQA
ncbi:MAG TPA: hypothetical protein VF546_20250 [Pyrinomonadaceae bacterium]|jgi:hypothetical protein